MYFTAVYVNCLSHYMLTLILLTLLLTHDSNAHVEEYVHMCVSMCQTLQQSYSCLYTYCLPPSLYHTPHICRTSTSPPVLRCFGAILLLYNEHTQGSLQRNALEILYDATNGGSWTTNTGWKTASDLNDWFGVTATSSTVVTVVTLNSNSLAGV
jgi:hypothetical protein